MAGRASAFAILGLDAGADAAAVDHAYKRLIKRHHPDREGGDAKRAAELNWAYRELRGARPPVDPLELTDAGMGPRRRPRLALAMLVVGVAFGGMLLGYRLSAPSWEGRAAQIGQPAPQAARRPPADPIADELHGDVIDAAAREAVRLYRTRDEMALTAASRDCHSRLREQPGTRLLDRCAAFDDAVMGLQDRDPLRDRGPFAPLAVIGRQWSAASLLSGDSLAIDSRLDQIRLRVELALAPATPPPPAVRDPD